jgi:hypothetical protein
MLPVGRLRLVTRPVATGSTPTTKPDALERARNYQVSTAAKRLIEYQRPENFIATWRSGLAEKMGRSGGALRTWEWVLEATGPSANGKVVASHVKVGDFSRNSS